MKKLLAILLVLAMCLSLCACGGNDSGASKKPGKDDEEATEKKADEKATAITLGTKNSVENYADFTLFKVATTKKITGTMGGGLYYENSHAGETYVDIILDWTNTSSATADSEEMLIASATNAAGAEYKCNLYAVETNNGEYVSQYENIAPLTTARVHCAISVPETETSISILLKVNGKAFSYDYTIGKTVSNAKVLAVGETMEAADYATVKFNGISYTDDLLPSNTSGYYSHYQIDDPSNTYLVVKYDLTNYTSTSKDSEDFVGIKAVYMDKYTYTGFVVAEETDGTGFDSYADIAPLETRHMFCLIKVPKTVITNDVTLNIAFNNQEYTFTGK